MKYLGLESGHLFKVGTCLRLGTYLIFIIFNKTVNNNITKCEEVPDQNFKCLLKGYFRTQSSGKSLSSTGTYCSQFLRYALSRGWVLINFPSLQDGCLFETGANSRLSG